MPLREPLSSGPSEPCVSLELPFVIILIILPLPRPRRRLCVCACIRLDMFFLSLSLSLSKLVLDVSVYLSIFSVRLPSNVSAIEADTGAELTTP